MDDVVAVCLTLRSGERRFVMTWGRIQHRVDPAPLETLVLRHARKFGLHDAVSAKVCTSLREARHEPYFYECLLSFARAPRPVDDVEWRSSIAGRMDDGQELYFLGEP